ncbi:MAG: histidine kinase [Verrucomicrobia bacterium]|nr:histidine kinase [Verrucomicrobiota bacterium]
MPALAFLLVSLFFAVATVRSAEEWQEGGRPLTRLFSRFDYRGSSSNWALAEGPDGLIWAGNNQGLLEFDGADWRLLPMPNGSAVRSLVFAQDGRCYVGAQDDLGVLESDESGTRVFRSLLDHIPKADRGFGDVWSVHALDNAIWFKTTSGVFVWRKGAMQVVKIESTTGGGVERDGKLYVFSAEKGLVCVSVPGETSVVPGSTTLLAQKALVRGAWTLLDGTTVLATESTGLWRWTDEGVAPWLIEPDAWLRENRIYTGLKLRNGRLVLGTVRGGVAVLHPDGRWQARYGRAQGLPDSPVLRLLEDRRNGLWLALENGLARIEPSLPVRAFGEAEGVRGIVNDSVRFAGRRYAATSLGLVRLRGAEKATDDTLFEPVPGVAKECWSVLVVGEELVVCTADGVWILGSAPDAVARQVTQQYAYTARRSRRHPGLIYIALRQGVTALQREANGSWRELPPLSGTKDEVWSLLEDPEGRLWAGTPYRGVWRADLQDGYRPDAQVEIFGEGEGLPGATPTMIARVDGQIAVATDAGLFRLAGGGKRFEPWDAPDVPRDPILGMAGDDTQDFYFLAREKGGKFGLFRWPVAIGGVRPAPERLVEFAPYARFECWEITREDQTTLWIGGSEGLLRINASQPREPAPGPRVILRRWEAGGDVLHGGAPERVVPPARLEYAKNRVRFAVGATAFAPELGGTAVRFRWWLEGLESGWGPWTQEFSREFTNLGEGAYRLRVQAADAFGVAGPELLTEFSVLPPWYRTPLAYAGWVALAAAGIALLLRWRLARQRSELLLAQRNRERLLRAETLARDAQLSALRSQVNPHFLFNALNAVRARVGESPEDARTMLGQLAGYFRRTLETPAALVPLREEFAALADYVALERARFGARLEVTLDCAEDVGGFEVPALLLQPLVENAIKYGSVTTPESALIQVEARALRGPRGVEIVVRNSGAWVEPGQAAPTESTGTGLANVRERLAQWRPDARPLEAGPAPDGQGVEVRLQLP